MRVPSCGDLIKDRYRLDEVLGEGASAWVFRAHDLRAQRDVALKIIKPEGEGYTPETLRRFDREVRIIANLQDPHTVTLYGSGRTTAGHLFMVFEFVEGEDLAELIVDRTRLLPYEVVHILEQLLESLREAHHNGLLHRDIKPENVRVFITPDDDLAVKLLDFGIAKPHDPDAEITRAGEIVGTPRYMSPEAFMEANLTAAADIYSVGIVAMEMLFGRDALHGNDWSEQYERLLTGHVFIFEGMDAIPDELMDVIEKMTQQKPERRYQSAAAALRALRDVRAVLDEPIDTVDENAEHVSSAPRSMARPLRPDTNKKRREPPPSRPESSGVPVRYVAVGAAVLALLTAVMFWWAVMRQEAPAAPKIPPAVLASQGRSRPPPAVAKPAAARPPAEQENVRSGCGQSPEFKSLAEQSLNIGLISYTWRTRIPRGYDNTRLHPVILFFHHDDSDGATLMYDAKFGELADRDGLVLIGVNSQSARDAWADPIEIEGVKPLLDKTIEQLCIDDRRVFLVGHGSGSHAVESLSCEPWVTGIATSSYLPQTPEFLCDATEPRAALHIAPKATRHLPVGGGLGCPPSAADMISVKELEGMWKDRNHCQDTPVEVDYRDGQCRKFDCDTPFTSCLIEGGFTWPGTGKRSKSQDPGGCDGRSSQFPSAVVIWDFFSSLPPLPEM